MDDARLSLQVAGKQERFCLWSCKKCGEKWTEATPRLDYPNRMPDFEETSICQKCLDKIK